MASRVSPEFILLIHEPPPLSWYEGGGLDVIVIDMHIYKKQFYLFFSPEVGIFKGDIIIPEYMVKF